MARIFISHSSRDRDYTQQIMNWLDESGFEHFFLDFDKHRGIKPGSNWERTLYRELERAQAVILVLTSNWMDSKWCFAEFTQARALGKAIFPIIMSPLGERLIASDIQQIDITKEGEGGLDRLAGELTEIALNSQGGFEFPAGRSPYPGLTTFKDIDAAIYFGRDDDIRKLIERLNARRTQGGAKLIALLGASGSGKSSLLRAGVLPRLGKDRLNWIVLPPFRPKKRPLDEFARMLATILDSKQNWRERLKVDGINDLLEDIAFEIYKISESNEGQILLPIDQGEELFSTAESGQKERFLELLDGLLDPNSPFISIFAMRSDFLNHLQHTITLKDRFEPYSLSPMPESRIPQIITGPAEIVGLEVEPALVQQATRDAKTADALPLLAFALRELHNRFGANNVLTLDNYLSLGDAAFRKDQSTGLNPLENAIRQRADEVIREYHPIQNELAALQRAFIPNMVRVKEGDYVRQPARWDNLPDKSHNLLNRLAAEDARLLTRGEKTIEVCHEALLRKWPLLRSWLDEEREFLIWLERIRLQAESWERADKQDKKHFLLDSRSLSQARNWSSLQSINDKKVNKYLRESHRNSTYTRLFRAATLPVLILLFWFQSYWTVIPTDVYDLITTGEPLSYWLPLMSLPAGIAAAVSFFFYRLIRIIVG